MQGKKPKKTGPKPKNLKIDGKWQDAVEKAVKKKKPLEGWPNEKKGK